MEREDLLLRRGDRGLVDRFAHGQAEPVLPLGDGDGPLQDALPLIGDRQLHLLRLADHELAHQHAAWLQIEPRHLLTRPGQGRNEARQADVVVGLRACFLGGAGQVSPATGGEEVGERTALQEVAGVGPFLLARLGQVRVAMAAPARGEGELDW